MICPRCEKETVELMSVSPINGAWEVYICTTCNYSWRSIESDIITKSECYDKRFKIDAETIPSLETIPPVTLCSKQRSSAKTIDT